MDTFIFDFDGSITDVQKEAVSYQLAFLEKLSSHLKQDLSETTSQFTKAQTKVIDYPHQYGWQVPYRELTVFTAPATCDPYLCIQAAARQLLEENRFEEKNSVLYELHLHAYQFAGTYFRPHAKEVLGELSSRYNLAVITNSKTDAVNQKLELLLGSTANISVIGNAKKYELFPDWTIVPETDTPLNFPVPVYLRRQRYYEAFMSLNRIAAVAGDIYTLDLSLPHYFGIPIYLIADHQSTTPSWEIDYVSSIENGGLIRDLSQLLNLL